MTTDYLSDNITEEKILSRMLNRLPSDLDKAEGSYLWDSNAPASYEFYECSLMAKQMLADGFASTTASTNPDYRSPYLDLRGEEHGIPRREAKKASKENGLKIFAAPGTIILAGLHAATPADAATNTPSIEFVTTNDVTAGADGYAYADIVALEGGTAGNVPAETITVLVTPVDGVTGVINPASLDNGLDIEDDQTYLARYLFRKRNPSMSGNRADYIFWAMEVQGVGNVSVIPVRDGAGTVSVAIIDNDKMPANQELVDTVQNYIAPPHKIKTEAEAMTIGGHGAEVDDTLVDDSFNSVKMVYDVLGEGTIRHRIESLLPQPGIWQARIQVKTDTLTAETDLVEVGIYDISKSTWCKISPSSLTNAVQTYSANQLTEAFQKIILSFYWDGQDQVELRISRLTTDTTTNVWIDYVEYRSTFSTDTGDGKAPIGPSVTVEPAPAVIINVSATLEILTGYDSDDVKATAALNIQKYLTSLAYILDNDVRWIRLGDHILDTSGVHDIHDLLINSGTINIPVGYQEVAVLGTVNFG